MTRANRKPVYASLLHVVRVACVCGLLVLIPSAQSPLDVEDQKAPSIDWSTIALPGFKNVSDARDAEGMWSLLDRDGNVVGKLARSLPAASSAIGYRGPSEAAIVLNNRLEVVSVQWLSSADTAEHVEEAKRDPDFARQFVGWKWGGPTGNIKIDGVSGATLTSLAFAKGIVLRLGGERPSLVFPDKLFAGEFGKWIPGKVTLVDNDNAGLVHDAEGALIGRVFRTGVLSDNLSGYQGPTELLVFMSPEETVLDLRLRKSFDNEPYVDYVRTERSFWKRFKGITLKELSQLDASLAEIEGVSGATMTSVTVADTLFQSAASAIAKASQPVSSPKTWSPEIRWTHSDTAVILLLGASLICTRLNAFRSKRVRFLWLVATVLVIGFFTGNLVSLALVAGWAAEGVAWELAPGLFAIVTIAFLIPPLSKGNPYCNHLCPHGALQQLIKPSKASRRHLKLPKAVSQGLRYLPGFMLVTAYLFLVLRPTTDLSSWEPFHAYLFRLAGWASISLAFLSLISASFIPMAYCRMGCATGRLIDYIRRTANSHRIEFGDYVVVALVAFALWINNR